MASRYKGKKIFTNASNLYTDFFHERKISYVNQYLTPTLPFMEAKYRAKISAIPHIWGMGDRYYKLADQHYDDPTYWWIIGWYNQKPLENDLVPGSVIHIPIPLDTVLVFINRGKI